MYILVEDVGTDDSDVPNPCPGLSAGPGAQQEERRCLQEPGEDLPGRAVLLASPLATILERQQ